MGHALEAHATANLKIERQFFWIFDAFSRFHQKRDGFLSIDGAMIVTEREKHHRAHFDLAIHCYGTRHALVHASNAALRRAQDRRREQGSVDTAVRASECAAM